MSKNVKLLLTENVEGLGIVGDVVNVRTGFARNYLLPRAIATTPSEEKVRELAAKRAEAERQLAELRKQREALIEKLEGLELHLERSCNDQGLLYGSITQQDVATALEALGHIVRPRDVRLAQTIKRVDAYDVLIKLDSDLEASIKLWVVSDRPLQKDEHPPAEAAAEPGADEKPSKADKAEKPAKAEKAEKSSKADKGEKPVTKGGWGERPASEAPAEKTGAEKPKAEKAKAKRASAKG